MNINNKFLKQGLFLEYTTLLWNVFGCGIVIMLGINSRSISLFGFGIDSVIEILASTIVIWQLKAINKDKEKLAEQLIGVSFILLSIYILFQSYISFTEKTHPIPSTFGVIFLAITGVVMFALAYGKKLVGKKINNLVLIAESKVTVIDGLLAVSVLIGLICNAYFDIWWADIIASLVIVWYGIMEAIHLLR